MKSQEILIAHPKTSEQVSALKAFMQALKIKFEISKEEPYSNDFVAKIEMSRKQAKGGKVTRIKKENLKEFLDL